MSEYTEKEKIYHYLSADEGWLAGFIGYTNLSLTEIEKTIKNFPDIIYQRVNPTFNSITAVEASMVLNISYTSRLFGALGTTYTGAAFSGYWSLKVFKVRSYPKFMQKIERSLNEGYLTNTPFSLKLANDQKENFLLHMENNLSWVLKSLLGIYEIPTAKDIILAFETVKNGIMFGTSVDEVSKRLITQAVVADDESWEFTFETLKFGPIRKKIFGMLMKLPEKALEMIEKL